MTRARAALPLALLLACQARVDDTDAPDTDPDDAPEAAVRLLPGLYLGQVTAIEDDTCGTLFDGVTLASITLFWTGDDQFELRYDPSKNVSTVTCEQDGDAVACSGFVQTFAGPPAATLTAVTTELQVTSETTYEVLWHWTYDCDATDDACGDLEARFTTTFPCSADLRASFQQFT